MDRSRSAALGVTVGTLYPTHFSHPSSSPHPPPPLFITQKRKLDRHYCIQDKLSTKDLRIDKLCRTRTRTSTKRPIDTLRAPLSITIHARERKFENLNCRPFVANTKGAHFQEGEEMSGFSAGSGGGGYGRSASGAGAAGSSPMMNSSPSQGGESLSEESPGGCIFFSQRTGRDTRI